MIDVNLSVLANAINKLEKAELLPRHCYGKLETCEYIQRHSLSMTVNEGLEYWVRVCHEFPSLCKLNARKRIKWQD